MSSTRMLHVDLGLEMDPSVDPSVDPSQAPSVRSDQSIISSQTEHENNNDASSTSSPQRSIHRHTTTYAPLYDSDTTPFILFSFPRIIFRWFYTFSLFLIMAITTVIVAVTPIDVIAQTSGSTFSGIKVFIVIIVCVVFIIISIIMYLSRIFQNRVAMNDIPSKSVYLPGRGDMPKRCYNEIEKKLLQSEEIRMKAGPLYNKSILIHYPGLSPPDYVQDKNINTFTKMNGGEEGLCPGTLLPPGACYEDIIRSLGDKFRLGGRVLTQIALPSNLSFREILIYIFKVYKTDPSFRPELIPDIKQLIEVYERMTFGPDLIKEEDILGFMVELEKLVKYCQDNYNGSLDYQQQRIRKGSAKRSIYDGSVLELQTSNSKSGTASRRASQSNTSKQKRRQSRYSYSSHFEPPIPTIYSHDSAQDGNRDNYSSDSSRSERRGDGSFRSVVMNKLAISRKGYREVDDPELDRDMGYVTDSEGGYEDEEDAFDTTGYEEYESHLGVSHKNKEDSASINDDDYYGFRRRF